MTRTEKLLRDLIALPSVNPAFLPPNDPRGGEKRMVEFLAAAASRRNLEVEYQKVLPNRSNLLVRLSPTGRVRQRVLLAPHLDTVNVAHESQFTPEKRNGKLFGRGACDTKGSVAAMFSALCELSESNQRPRETEIIFAGLVDEENAQTGSRALAAGKLKAGLAIVGEPTSLQVVTAHKGSMWVELETRGKAAHGSRPELGCNAVHEMARIVDWLQTDYASLLRRRQHPLLGRATVSVGTINGGTQANIVPDRCTALVDRRTLPGETEAGVAKEIQSLLRRRKLKANLLNGKLAPCLPMETDPELPLVQQFLRSTGSSGPTGVDYFCDASILSLGGIPSIVFGPGDIAHAHTADEWISPQELERAKKILVIFLKSLP